MAYSNKSGGNTFMRAAAMWLMSLENARLRTCCKTRKIKNALILLLRFLLIYLYTLDFGDKVAFSFDFSYRQYGRNQVPSTNDWTSNENVNGSNLIKKCAQQQQNVYHSIVPESRCACVLRASTVNDQDKAQQLTKKCEQQFVRITFYARLIGAKHRIEWHLVKKIECQRKGENVNFICK